MIWANFAGAESEPRDRGDQRPARRSFIRKDPASNYITVRGFVMRHAATQWAPPTTQTDGPRGHALEQGVDHRGERD